ncbi:cyclopropane-fatty-acyl-phospholipid synthase family protein [Shimia sp.]|uniref:SAM-dependent methyltransferase n=1 Tax=Shimia sp. TaxID=1954381 RepID=UPI0035622716
MTIDPETLDYAMFDTQDFVNIILQRSDVLSDIPGSGKLIKGWSTGETAPLLAVARDKNRVLAQRAVADIAAEFTALRGLLDQAPPGTIADIGCGYGFFDLFAARMYGARVHLIDLETNSLTHFGFNRQGAAYSNLQKAGQFLTRNGVAAENITLSNPERDDLSTIGPVDLAVSFLACGFHFPVDVYMEFFATNVARNGRILLDLRHARRAQQVETLSSLGRVEVLSERSNRARVLVTKGA